MAEREDLEWALAAFADGKAATYGMYRKYAAGDHSLRFASSRYMQAFSRVYSGFSYNRCSGVVAAHADRLVVENFAPAPELGEDAEDTIRQLWDANRMDARADAVHREMFLAGDAYVIIWPDAASPVASGGIPNIWPQTAEQIRVRYDSELPGRITLAARLWIGGDNRFRCNVYSPAAIYKWVSRDAATIGTIPKNAEAFLPYMVEGEAWPILNPFGEVPVVGFHNGANTGVYGRSELADVIPIQDALNKVTTDLLMAAELGGFPQKIILGLDSDDPSVMEGLRRIESGLSKIITISSNPDGNAPSIAEFSATNLGQLREVVELFDTLVSRVSRVPVHWLTMAGSFPSGSSLRAAEAPFVSKLTAIQSVVGNAWEDAIRLGLRMMGNDVANGRIQTIWKPVEQLDIIDKWAAINAMVAAGVPLKYALLWNGVDPSTVEEITMESAMDTRRLDMLVTGMDFPTAEVPAPDAGGNGNG